jgi:hypothetical protein
VATADTARLIASLELQDKFSKTADAALTKVDRIDKRLGAFSGAVNRNLSRAVDATISRGVRALTGSVTEGLGSLAELEDATTAVDGAIVSTGKTWSITSADIAASANEIELATQAAFDDKAITNATATLIRYGGVTEDNLKPAMVVMTDLAARTGDVDSAATLLGKALADPTKAAGKLARQGIILTKKQQDLIEGFVEAGDTGKAQGVILDALAKTTGGAAADSAGKYRDTLNLMTDASEDAKKALAEGFFPVIQRVSSKITELANDPATLQRLRDFGTSLAGAFDKAIDVAEGIDWRAMGDGLKSAAGWAQKVWDAFNAAPAEAKGMIIALAGLSKLTGGAPIKIAVDFAKEGFGRIFDRGSSPGNALWVKQVGGAGLGGGTGGGNLGAAGKALGGLAIVGELAAVVAVQQEVSSQNSAIAADIHTSLNDGIKTKTPAELLTALNGVNQGINDLQANPLNVLVAGSALDELRGMRSELAAALGASGAAQLRGAPGGGPRNAEDLAKSIAGTKLATQDVGDKVTTMQGALDTSILATRDATREAKERVAAAVASGAVSTGFASRAAGNQVAINASANTGRILAGLRGLPVPIVNVDVDVSASTVVRQTTTIQRSTQQSSRSDDNFNDHR